MIKRHNQRTPVKERGFGQSTLFIGNAGEAFELFGIDDSEIEAGLRAVVEEDGIDDLTSTRWQPERDRYDAEDSLDVRNLLFDEAD